MQNQFFTPKAVKKAIAAGILPVMLSSFIALSASAPAVAKPATPAPATKSAPAKKAMPAAKSTDSKDKKEKAATPQEIDASIAAASKVDSLALMQNPTQYMNKKVTFTGTFNRFADTALDYKKAFRDSRDYVSFFILRPDVTDHTIPMAEMKLFFPRKRSDEVMELDPGDKVQIVGTEFSTALDEPWIDVEHIKVVEKTAKPEKKHTQPEF